MSNKSKKDRFHIEDRTNEAEEEIKELKEEIADLEKQQFLTGDATLAQRINSNKERIFKVYTNLAFMRDCK